MAHGNSTTRGRRKQTIRLAVQTKASSRVDVAFAQWNTEADAGVRPEGPDGGLDVHQTSRRHDLNWNKNNQFLLLSLAHGG